MRYLIMLVLAILGNTLMANTYNRRVKLRVGDMVIANTEYVNVGVNGWIQGRLSKFYLIEKDIYFCEIDEAESRFYPTFRFLCIPGKNIIKVEGK